MTAAGQIIDGDLVSYQRHAERLRRLKWLDRASRIMDTAIGIPGTRFRFGADSILGLVPGLGDVVAATVALAIVNEARRMGLPSDKLARMLVNIALDGLVGTVPIVGDIFDIYFKSNRRNMQMILDHFGLAEFDGENGGRR
jgi:hypothetical protein